MIVAIYAKPNQTVLFPRVAAELKGRGYRVTWHNPAHYHAGEAEVCDLVIVNGRSRNVTEIRNTYGKIMAPVPVIVLKEGENPSASIDIAPSANVQFQNDIQGVYRWLEDLCESASAEKTPDTTDPSEATNAPAASQSAPAEGAPTGEQTNAQPAGASAPAGNPKQPKRP